MEVVPVEVVALEVVPFELVPLEAMMLHPSTTVTAHETTVTPSETATVIACRLAGRADCQQNPQCGKCHHSDSFRNGKVAHLLPLFSPTVSDGERSKRIHPGGAAAALRSRVAVGEQIVPAHPSAFEGPKEAQRLPPQRERNPR